MQQQLSLDFLFYEQEAEICKAFAHPMRLRLLAFLGERERSVSEIRRELAITGSNLSQHLRILKAAGVLSSVRRQGQVYCACAFPEIMDVCRLSRKLLKEQVRRQRRWPV